MLLEEIQSLTDRLFQGQVDLLPGVNEVFELELSYMEYHSLEKRELLDRSAYFKSVGGELTRHYKLFSKAIDGVIDDYVNDESHQFSSGYASHGLFPYRGKFHPQMIKALMNITGIKAGDKILDPMAGSGTTNIEAALLGFDSFAIDVSPFCQFMIQTKHEALSIDPSLLEYLPPKRYDLFEYFEKGNVLARLDDIADPEKKKVYNLAFLAYLDAMGYAKRVKKSDHPQLFGKVLIKYHTAMKNFLTNPLYPELHIGQLNMVSEPCAMNMNIEDSSIDCVITSPPYSFAIDYMENDYDQLVFLGYDPEIIRTKLIGLKGKSRSEKLDLYFNDMDKVCSEVSRILKCGKFFIMVIGSNTNQTGGICLENTIIESAKKYNMPLVKSMLKPIRGMRNTMKDEYVLMFKKGEMNA
ncbi:MAG: hypothetical protein Q8M98_04285 [Candidatus Cloacimonadaceae bacterium]|nr:hypothetical protein [Candidatus Cloacimonadaceae bacterium]MDP3113977.1 hypothetical protein [Candidatus Cloacimonadaceae bacterium]